MMPAVIRGGVLSARTKTKFTLQWRRIKLLANTQNLSEIIKYHLTDKSNTISVCRCQYAIKRLTHETSENSAGYRQRDVIKKTIEN